MRISYLFLVFAFGLTFLTACEKQNIDETTTKEEEVIPDVVTCNLALSIVETPAGIITANVSNGTAPFLYNWSTGDSTKIINVATSGTYALTVTDGEGCTITDTISVSINNTPCQSFAATIAENPAGTLTVTATGGTVPYSYAWATGQTTSVITVQSNGTYLVSVTDASGCIVETAFYVTSFIDACGSFGIDIIESPVGTLTAVGTGGTAPYAYTWETGETTATITVPNNGFYGISVTDAMGCFTDTAYTVNGIGNPCASLSGLITHDGAGTLTMTASGGTAPYTYAWSSGETTAAITVATNGTYTVTITDSQGCTFTTSKFVTVNDPCFGLAMNLVSIPTGGTHTLQSVTGGTPPYTYLWSNGSTSTFATIYTPGTYTVSVTDSVGCVISEDFVVQ